MNRLLRDRLAGLERGHLQCEPTAILADRWLENGEAVAMLANWRGLVASGEATVNGSALVVAEPGEPMLDEAWEAARCRPELLH